MTTTPHTNVLDDATRAIGALLWQLYNHQGYNSPIGQPIRKVLNIARDAAMTEEQIAAACRYGESIARPPAATLTPPAEAAAPRAGSLWVMRTGLPEDASRASVAPVDGPATLLTEIERVAVAAGWDGHETDEPLEKWLEARLTAAPQPAAQQSVDGQDAARWRESLMHVGACDAGRGQFFAFRFLTVPGNEDLMRGSTAEHFTNAIDAAIAHRDAIADGATPDGGA